MPKTPKPPPDDWVTEIQTVWSHALGRYVEVLTLLEERVMEILDTIDLGDIESEEAYQYEVLRKWPGLDKHFGALADVTRPRLVAELWPLVLAANPMLQPQGIMKHEVIKGRAKAARAVKKEVPKQVVKVEKKEEPVREPVKDIPTIRKLVDGIRGELERNVVGQRKAIKQIVGALGKAMLAKEQNVRPIASLFFAGESGVGKTEVARQLATALGGELVQINCGEYAESHTAARLIGAPPGYIGFDQGGLLESKVKPASVQVLLFDEFEKAHPRLQYLLLSAMEDGHIDTGNNKRVDLRRCVIILTSNIGAEEWTRVALGFNAKEDEKAKAVLERVKKSLPVEFINRLTATIIFDKLTITELQQIAEMQLTYLRTRVAHMVELQWPQATVTMLCAKLPPGRGARPIRNRVEEIESDICNWILADEQAPTKINLCIDEQIGLVLASLDGSQQRSTWGPYAEA